MGINCVIYQNVQNFRKKIEMKRSDAAKQEKICTTYNKSESVCESSMK